MKKKSRIWSYENAIVIMMFFAFGFVFMDRLSITFLFPFITPALHLSNTQIGMLVSILSICWALSAWLVASYSDLKGTRKKLLLLVIVVFAFASVLSGFVGGFVMLLLARGLMGAAEGPVFPIASVAVTTSSTISRRGFNLGFVQSSAGLLGSTIGPLLVVGLALAYSWRDAFYILAIPALILALIIAKYMKEPIIVAKNSDSHKKLGWEDYKVIFKHRNIWIALICSMGFMTWLFTFTTFAPLFLTEVDKLTQGQMGLAMSALGLGSFVWGFSVPAISDRIGRKPSMIIFALIATFSPIILAVVHVGVGALMILLFFLTVGQGYAAVFMSVIPSESVPPIFVASAISVIMMVGELFGGTLLPTIAGIAADHYGLTAPLWISACGSFVVFIASFALKETAPIKVGNLVRRVHSTVEQQG